MAPSTMKQWFIKGQEKGFEGLEFLEVPVPKVGENEVLVKLHAASLNYRDVAIAKNEYPSPLRFPFCPGSDGAGEVIEIGSKVTKFRIGDKVATLFHQGHLYGDIDSSIIPTSLGGFLDGTLRQFGVYNENGLVKTPNNLDLNESSTLSCAALTAWNALYGLKPLKPGDSVLIQGTGGVSIFALQFAKAAGATIIATTSTKEKEEALKKLGAHHTINYKEDANWGKTAKSLTSGQSGVDFVIDVAGSESLHHSIDAIRVGGIINLIGFLSGKKPQLTMELLFRGCTARGVHVGSRQQMEEMVKAIEANDIHPVIDDKVFNLESAREAYDYVWNHRQFGKVVIKISE
ncbi:uncharacterized protein F4817DRAFT_348977 [Daldinia loculata]|uniref:uncharacterized protein n=1 Tax=Daldinia loculata TaxID=103429 RepID=UPI0020C44679|nr:uncharacterized protein F4817DRAFT_348977 [Daldinia loculata]KAI1643659.1 hypothetical protein F4817DRAFT_348977 [Daldinia loculata]